MPGARWLPLLLALLLTLALAACAGAPPELPEPQWDPEPAPSEVERILFLIGDAGEAKSFTSPVLNVLQRDVEEWADRLTADSAVAVLYLGDIRYPFGLRPRRSDNFTEDTTVIMAQVRVVAGPRALERGARGYFLAGNHDWGVREDFAGYLRLRRLDQFLDLAADLTGASVRLAPEPGSGGPFVLDWSPDIRLLMLDTAWWLMAAEEEDRDEFLDALDAAVESAGDRTVIFAAHHPLVSVGMHGGRFSLTEKLGIGYVLRRAGAWVQSLNSPAYRKFTGSLRATFARHGPPFLFIGGHDHSLQVIERVRETDPTWNLISGSGSKLTDVGPEPGLHFARSAPGYMRLLLTRDGGIHVTVVGGAPEYLLCPEDDAPWGACLQAGIATFETLHSQRLR
jgi:hypothetical protein